MLRLRRKNDIRRSLQEGRRIHSPCIVLHARRRGPDEELPPLPRLAVVAGRRFRTAVARNRARRVLRESSRLALAGGEAPWDLVVVARPQVLALSFPDRLNAITELLREARVLGGKSSTGT